MTDAEKAELLQLLEAKAKATARVKKDEPGFLMSLGRGGLQGATMGFGDELIGGGVTSLIQAGANMLPKSLAQKWDVAQAPAGDAYRFGRDEERKANAAAQKAHKWAYLGGNVAGGLASAAVTPGFAAAKGAGLGMRALAGLGNGVAQGAVFGLGASEAKDVAGMVKDTLTGGVVGGALGGALPVVGAGGRAIYRGIVKPTEAAKFLERQGVDNLTVGQMQPGSLLAQLEEAGTSVSGAGPAIQAQREAAKTAWQEAVMREALPPGMAPPARGTPAHEALDAAYGGFEAAYAPAKAAAIPEAAARALPRALSAATERPGVLATDETRRVVDKFLQNEATLLDKVSPAAEQLLQIRSNIRRAARDALRGEDYTKGQLLEGAEAEVTKSLEAQLSGAELVALRKADQAYSKYKTVEGAMHRAGDAPGGMTPAMLSNQLKSTMDRGAYARGGGDELRDLAAAGRQALDTRSPVTGARALMLPLTSLPLAKEATAAGSAVANMPWMKNALLGRAFWQRPFAAADEAITGALPRHLRNPVGAEAEALIEALRSTSNR